MKTVIEHPASATTTVSAEKKKLINMIIDVYVHERVLIELSCESENLLAIFG